MLQLSEGAKHFGHKQLFEGANWLITPEERTGLVGGNGTGKSTLLKVLAGVEQLDGGALNRSKGLTIGYLPQDGLTLRGRTVFDECLSVFAHAQSMEREMETLSEQLATIDPSTPEYMAVADRFSDVSNELHAHDLYNLDAQVGAVLGGLGFSKEDWSRYTEEFSGGWQMRIALAKLLLEKPSLLLLDEPTNHLDLETRNWLEDYLRSYPRAFILISHDRYFLDVTVTKITEVWNKRVWFYTGGYEKYVKQKTERRAQLASDYKNQKDRIEQLEAFISRFRYQATKAKQVQSRIKELEKIERIEVPEDEETIHFSFPQPPGSGRAVCEVTSLSKRYEPKQILSNVNFTIERGDRIALVGPNGAGKSTLIRMLSQLEEPTSGTVRYGHNVVADYFAQDQYKVLNPNAKMLEDISAAAPRVPTVELRNLLGAFLFAGDDVFKTLGVLSGGERNRYALARMLVSPANFILLDEPTNHLDLRAKDVLLEAIRAFTGTVLFVSHDRYFIDGLATRVFECEHGGVQVFPGNYEDYLWRKGGGPEALQAAAAEIQRSPVPAIETLSHAAEPSNGTGKKVNPIKLKQMQERVRFAEDAMPRMEEQMTALEAALGNFTSAEASQRQTAELARLRGQHEELMLEWETISTQLEEQGATA